MSKFGSWLILLNYMCDSKFDNICIFDILVKKMIEKGIMRFHMHRDSLEIR